MTILPPMRFTGADVLRDGALVRGPVVVRDGRIGEGEAPSVDLSGYLVLPGIVDLNMGPLRRAGALTPTAAIAATDREAAAHGVTTGWIAQGWSWKGGADRPEAAMNVMAALAIARPRTNLRLQLRVETHMPETRAALIAAVTAHEIDQVIFTDALPEAIQLSHRAGHKLAAWAEAEGWAPEDFIRRLRMAKDAAPDVPRHLLALAEAFDRLGVIYGSHDDPDGETRERMGTLGAKLAEFPLRAGAAAIARCNHDPIVFCAADILRAGPRPGGVSTMALVTKGMGDALASRDHPATLVEAVNALVDSGTRSFAEAWAMISTGPARIMRLADRGRIDTGLRADLTILNADTRAVEGTICAGGIAHLSGDLALRLVTARADFALAAE